MVSMAASIMCADQINLKEELVNLKKAGVDMLHCDVMDGVFVNNMAMGPYVLEQIKHFTDIPLDIHLATIDPEKYIKMFLNIKPAYMSFHIETTDNPEKLIDLLKSNHIGVSVAISPQTEVSKIVPILKDVDMVLMMTVNPGFAGQEFNYSVLDKLNELREICSKLNVSPIVEVDGNINKDTIPKVVKAGADVLVLGTSGLFKKDNNYIDVIRNLRNLTNDIEIN